MNSHLCPVCDEAIRSEEEVKPSSPWTPADAEADVIEVFGPWDGAPAEAAS